MMAKPRAQVRAVRRVPYRRERPRAFSDDVHSIIVPMHLNDANQAPVWRYPRNGWPGAGVTEAIRRCRRIARLLSAARKGIATLDLPADDKRQLRTALAELPGVRTRAGLQFASAHGGPA